MAPHWAWAQPGRGVAPGGPGSGHRPTAAPAPVVLAGLACAAALVFALVSLDGFRSRTCRGSKRKRPDAPTRRAGPDAAAAGGALGREARSVAAIGGRLDPLAALLRSPAGFPPGPIISLRGNGREWQIDGYAREAAPLVALWKMIPRSKDVHFLSATSRTRMNGNLYESFSIALRLVSSALALRERGSSPRRPGQRDRPVRVSGRAAVRPSLAGSGSRHRRRGEASVAAPHSRSG